MSAIKNIWFNNKPLFVSLMILILLLIRIIFISFYMFTNLKAINATINKINLSKDGSKTYLTIGLHNDSNIYYQRYKNRFYDKKIIMLNERQIINFYTAKNPLYSPPPLWNDGKQKGFYYYPVFNIDSSRSIMDVFLFNFYRLNLFNFLFYLSILSTILYGFFYIVHSKGIIRVLFFMILALVFWIWYP